MSNNTGEKNSYKTLQSLKSHINTIPTDEIAKKLGLDLDYTWSSPHGDCPYGHSSKSGRCFSINLKDNYWKCFQCNQSGDNIKLVEVALKTGFKEAVDWIAQQFGIEYDFDMKLSPENQITEEELIKLNLEREKALLYEKIFSWMHELLFKDEGRETLDYLVSERRYEIEVLKKSEFCFFPSSGEIRKYLLDLMPEAAEKIKLLPLNGAFGDNFRLALPYRNAKGQITGFIKRAIQPKGIPSITIGDKIYNDVRWDSTKGLSKHDIFNLNKCDKKEKTLIVLEGYPDAVYFTASGMNNVVAAGQGRLSKSHLEALIRNKIERLIISFDRDDVGPKNTESAVKLLLTESEIIPFVLDPESLSPHKDPDEYVRASGIEEFKKLLTKVKLGSNWLIDRMVNKYDEDNELNNNIVLHDLIELSTKLSDPVDQAYLVDKVSSVFKKNKSDLKKLIESEKIKFKYDYYKKIKSSKNYNTGRYLSFIERSTSSYSYWDKEKDKVYLNVGKEILENILISAQQKLPPVFPVLQADFNVHMNERFDIQQEIFNLFVPTKYLLLKKNSEIINPVKSFPAIYKLLINLIPKYRERKMFLNWLAGIMQTREKQLTAWVFKGVQGTGKNVLLERVLQPLFGTDQARKVENQELHSEFNPWLQNAMFIAFNEVVYDKNTTASVKSKLKAIITDPVITINEKQVRNYDITNNVNCIFFSNEKIPVIIENQDRRFNVVNTGKALRDYDWFSQNPEGFLHQLEDEVGIFAQFLMNWKYDSNMAKTCIDNEEKELMVTASMNRFEEFAYHLRHEDIEWFEENISSSIGIPMVRLTKNDINGKIRKELALKVFNEIFNTNPVNEELLGQHMKLNGINSDKTCGKRREN